MIATDDTGIENPFAMRARLRRAEKLAAEIRLIGIPVENVLDAQADWWQLVAARAGIRPPSPTTIAMTIGLLASPGLAGLPTPEGEPCR